MEIEDSHFLVWDGERFLHFLMINLIFYFNYESVSSNKISVRTA